MPHTSRIANRFAALRQKGEKALVAYIMAGDPTPEATPRLVRALEKGGADIIELGLPFSDPLADGPVIQAAGQRALRNGMTTDRLLGIVAEVRRAGSTIPIAVMGYYNMILARGVERFCADAKAAGVDGLIVPDLPLEESEPLLAATRAQRMNLVPFIAPTSTPDRLKRTAAAANGFIYAVSLTGVTGERESLPVRFKNVVTQVRQHTDLPVAVGFGISRPEQVREVCTVADGVIVGTAFCRICGEGLPEEELARRMQAYAAELKAATRG
jgi:tryptophan synthase alpha chain